MKSHHKQIEPTVYPIDPIPTWEPPDDWPEVQYGPGGQIANYEQNSLASAQYQCIDMNDDILHNYVLACNNAAQSLMAGNWVPWPACPTAYDIVEENGCWYYAMSVNPIMRPPLFPPFEPGVTPPPPPRRQRS